MLRTLGIVIVLVSTAVTGYHFVRSGWSEWSDPSPRVVPRFPVLSADDTRIELSEVKQAAEEAAAVQNMLAGATAVIAAVCAVTRQPMCAGVTSIISGVTWFGSAAANQVATDLGSPDYQRMTTAENQTIDVSRLPNPTRMMILDLIRAEGLAQAICITSIRATAAAQAKSTYWFRQQLAALRSYQEQLNAVLGQLSFDLGGFSPIPLSLFNKMQAAIHEYRVDANELMRWRHEGGAGQW